MDAAQMFKAFFGNGNGAGMHHAFHHHFGFGSNNASNMPGGAFFQFTQELYILTYCLVYICTIFLRFIEIQTGFFTKKKSNVCFIKIRSKHSSNTLVSLLRIFMKQTLVTRTRTIRYVVSCPTCSKHIGRFPVPTLYIYVSYSKENSVKVIFFGQCSDQ